MALSVPSTIYAGYTEGAYSGRGGVSVSTASPVDWVAAGTTTQGVQIAQLAVAPTDPNTVYVTAASGSVPVFATTNGTAGAATSWSSSASPTGTASAIAVDPTSPNHALMGTSSGLYATTDGLAWTAVTNMTGSPIDAIAFDPKGGVNVYVEAAGGLFISADHGATFPTRGVNLPEAGATVIAVDPVTTSNLLIGFGNQSVYLSSDSGQTWALSGLTDWGINALAYDAQYPNIVYAGTKAGGMYQSVSGGE
jgi:hypothetical protein